MAIFKAAVEETSLRFAEMMDRQTSLPPLSLTTAEYESGDWHIPKCYRDLVLHITAELFVHGEYALSAAQLRLALIRGSLRSNRLVVDGITLRDEPKKRMGTCWVPRTKRRIRCLFRDQKP